MKRFFLSAVLLLLISFVLLPTFASASSLVRSSQPYKIKDGYTEAPQKLLLISGYYEGEYSSYYERKFDALSQIITSHWNVDITSVKEAEYRQGLVGEYDVIFYIKEHREDIPAALANDLRQASGKKVILSGFNGNFFSQITSANILAKDQPVTEVRYKGVDFLLKADFFLTFDTKDIIEYNNVTRVFGVATDSSDGTERAFAFKLNNGLTQSLEDTSDFLFLPFILPDYYETNSYSTIFLDLLYEGIGGETIKPKQALLRLEDVNVSTYHQPDGLQNVYRYLKSESVPFHLALIVRYIDPTKDIDMSIDGGRRFSNLLKKMIASGHGTVVMHGYTHQIDSSVSAIGYEFWDENSNSPLKNESEISVLNRLRDGFKEYERLQLPKPEIWETPHYAASDLAHNIFNDVFPLRYEEIPGIGFLPFPVLLDNTIYIPENLGFVSLSSDGFDHGQNLQEIEKTLSRLNVFRSATPSVFWHPWRDISELKYLVKMIKGDGYTFVSLYDLIESVDGELTPEAAALAAFRKNYHTPTAYQVQDILIAAIYIFFILGCLVYLRTIIHLKRYTKDFDRFKLSLEGLIHFAETQRIELPKFSIFVPARNEGLVIGNTIHNLVSLDYPKDKYQIVVITDERELDDEVEVTTKAIVEELAQKINSQHNTELVTSIEVPRWYSGEYGNFSENAKKSTKGRALNYALQVLENGSNWLDPDLIGVLDADGRLHPNVLKEAAYKRITSGSQLLQGPVLQISNYNNVSLIGVAAGIELAIHHLTELPNNLLRSKRAQFLAGTNYFIDKDLISRVGGWDQDALVEDAELALRIYIHTRIKAEWIGSPEIEQTPENFSVYRKQRRRWVRGHLDLIKVIRQANLSFGDKLYFFWKILSSQFRFIFDLGFPILAIGFLIAGLFLDLSGLSTVISLFLIFFAVFILDLYGYIYRHISNYIDPNMSTGIKIKMSIRLFFFSPILMFAQSIPRLLALSDYIRAVPTRWYKTERTAEKLAYN